MRTARQHALEQVVRQPVAREIERAAGRLQTLLELRREGCPHSCCAPCPHTRRLDEKIRAMGVTADPETLTRR